MARKFLILHGHGQRGPKGKRSYLKFGSGFKTKEEAKKWAKKNLQYGEGERFFYVPSSKVGKTSKKKLFYIKKK